MATRKTIFDYMSEEDYARYNELLEKANTAKAEAKANAPKTPRVKKPQTAEQKAAAIQARMAKYQAQLDALLAGNVEG